MKQNTLIPGPVGNIEINIENADTAPRGLMIICHPNSSQGGSMQNKVVTTIAKCARDAGFISVRFNFRGVSKSEGEYDAGRGEVDDLMAVVKHVQTQYPGLSLILAGFSFGSYVAFQAALTLKPQALLSLAPPADRHAFMPGEDFNHHDWLVIMPDADEVVDPQTVYAWHQALPHPPRLLKLTGASHFFHGRLIELRDIVSEWLKTQ